MTAERFEQHRPAPKFQAEQAAKPHRTYRKTMCSYRMDDDVLDMLKSMSRHFKCQGSELLRFVVREYHNGPFLAELKSGKNKL